MLVLHRFNTRGMHIFLSLFNEIQKGLSDLLKHLHSLVPCLLTFYMFVIQHSWPLAVYLL